MNLYIIPAWYPKNEDDVTCCFFREQAHALAKSGNNVTVIHISTLSIKEKEKPSFQKRLWQDDDVRTVFYEVKIPIPRKFEKIQDKYISKTYYKILKKQIEDDIKKGYGKPDIIHSHVSHCCGYYCVNAAKRLDVPVVVTEHFSGLLLGTATESDYARLKYAMENSNAFVFVGTNFQKTICKKLGFKGKTYVIPNMIDVDLYRKKQRKNETFVFLSACHLKKNKSIDLVIKSFNKTFVNDEKVQLVIAGDGEEMQNLKQLVSELHEERIEFKGRYSREESIEMFSNADAFVLTSEVETFGIVYIESLASGIPVIATKGQGGEDIVNEKNGFLVEYGNIDQLSEAMKKLYLNKEDFDADLIIRDCKNRFSEKSVCMQIEKIYNKVLESGEF